MNVSPDLPLARPLVAVFWMVVTGLCFVIVNILVKVMGGRLPAAESAFLRYVFGLLFLLPVLARLNLRAVAGKQHLQFALRGLFHGAGVMLWFFAISRISLAEVTALNYLAPVYVTLGAAVFLGEKLAFRRISAVVLALVGACIILRPGFRELGPGHWAMVGTGLVFGVSYLLAKVLADKLEASVVVAMMSVWVTLVLAPFAIAVWVPPLPQEYLILAAVAVFATYGHYTMTLALAAAPVAVSQPVTFLQLVWAALVGALFFGEGLDVWVMSGGGLILASVCFIAWREARLNRRTVTPPSPATKL